MRKLPFLFLWMAFVVCGADKPGAEATFKELTGLAGDWTGTRSDGHAVRVTYEVVSGGSALLERLQSAGEAEMVTIYTVDGDRLSATHYCSARNQPSMQTEPLTAVTMPLRFRTVRVANLTSPEEGHMSGLVLARPDPIHLTQEWSWKDGKGEQVNVFRYTRKK